MRSRQPVRSNMFPTIRKQKTLWRQLLGWFNRRAQKKQPADQVAEQLQVVRSAFRSELAGVLAAALYAKKTLDTTRHIDIPFPDALFAGDQVIDDAARAGFIAYAAELEKFQSELYERDTPISAAAARGLTTWIVSMYAAASPELMPQAREMWAKLVTAGEGVEEGYRFLLRREPSEIERGYFTYRPHLFLR
jgi:hypothetical protein